MVSKNWLLVLSLCCMIAFTYFQAAKKKKALLTETLACLERMEKEKKTAEAELELLQLKIASEADPAWIELILMRDLGVVPEGYLKVHFSTAS